MTLIIIAIAIGSTAAFAVMAFCAPHGFQDERGFHYSDPDDWGV